MTVVLVEPEETVVLASASHLPRSKGKSLNQNLLSTYHELAIAICCSALTITPVHSHLETLSPREGRGLPGAMESGKGQV